MDHISIRQIDNEMVLLRIIPDRSITNNQSKKFWRLIHELLELDHGLKHRIIRDGLKFTYKLRDTVWVEIIARCSERREKGEEGVERIEYDRSVEFFLGIPAKFERTFRQKLTDRNPNITIENVDLTPIQIPDTADVTEFRLMQHDIFPLKCDDREQTSPISSILNAAYDLSGNDSFRFSVALERISRAKWEGMSTSALSQIDQKRIPSRARVDWGLLRRQMRSTGRFVIGEARSVIEDVMQALQNVFMKSDKPIAGGSKKKPVEAEYERLMTGGEWGNTRKKAFDPTFKARIRLAIDSGDRARQHLIRCAISNALAELNGENTLQPQRVRVNVRGKVIYEMNSLQIRSADRDPNILSTKEVGKLNQYPTAELQERYSDILKSKRRIEVDIPKSFRDPSGIYIGDTERRGEKIDIYIPYPKNDRDADEFMMSRVFIGSPRMGKDTAIVNFMVEAAKRGCGGIVLDVVNERGNTRGMADSLRDALPADRIIDLDASDVNWPFYIGLNEVVARSDNAGNRLANDFATVFEVEDNGRTRTYLREAIKACNGDLLGVRLLLLSDGNPGDYLDDKIKELKKAGRDYQAAFWEAYKDESRGMKSQIRGPIINRLDEIFGDDHLKNMFGQSPNEDIDFATWLKEGKVVLIRVPNSSPNLSELSVKVISQWIVLKTFYTKLMMADKGCYSFLVINEPHQFMSDGLVKVLGRMLRECPKWRLSMLFAIHDFSPMTIPSDLVTALLSASMNWHIFKNTNINVYNKLLPQLRPTYTPEEAMDQTPKHHSIGSFFMDGEYKTPFLIHAPFPANERNTPFPNGHLTEQHSRKYGRAKEEVEREIFEKEQILFSRNGRGRSGR